VNRSLPKEAAGARLVFIRPLDVACERCRCCRIYSGGGARSPLAWPWWSGNSGYRKRRSLTRRAAGVRSFWPASGGYSLRRHQPSYHPGRQPQPRLRRANRRSDAACVLNP